MFGRAASAGERKRFMRFLGNILWFVLCGIWLALFWSVVGLLWCVTIVGIPVGLQCFKFAGLMLAPFGRQVLIGTRPSSVLLNLLWLVFGGVELAASAAVMGLVLCVTVVGIPFGLQCFKFASLALLPFGAHIVYA